MEAGLNDPRAPKRRRDDSDDDSDFDAGDGAIARSRSGARSSAGRRPRHSLPRERPLEASRTAAPGSVPHAGAAASAAASPAPSSTAAKGSRRGAAASSPHAATAVGGAGTTRFKHAPSPAASGGAADSGAADSGSEGDDDLDAQLMSPTDVSLPTLKSRGRRRIVHDTEPEDFEVDTTWVAETGAGDEAYEVSCVVAERGSGKSKQVRVRWVGWPPSDDTWEPAASFPAKDKIAEFQADRTLLGLAAQVDKYRRYLEKGSHFENSLPVTKQDRGKVRAVLLYLLRRLADAVCGPSEACKHARNVLGSCVYPSARQVPPLVSRCIADFSAVKQRGARLLNAEGFLTDVSYPDLLKPLWKVAQAIEQATVDEISANERALLEGYEDSE